MNVEKAEKQHVFTPTTPISVLPILTIIFSPEDMFLALREQVYTVMKQEPCGENKP